MHIASSTFYRWRHAGCDPCERRRRDAELADRIKGTHADPGGNHGSPRVPAVLRREGTRVGRKRVERLMRGADLAGVSPRRKGFTRRDPKAALAPEPRRGRSWRILPSRCPVRCAGPTRSSATGDHVQGRSAGRSRVTRRPGLVWSAPW
ncbi:IS3 family transposase [Streptomyces sp. NPDC004296]|uniref:IS3 family transposase n=1 Tax=Streptomyces sp. NPDC004296 TaxID=3364697 RepID=UPI0036881F57